MANIVPAGRNKSSGTLSLSSMLDDFFSNDWLPASLSSGAIKIDVQEDDQEYTIDADMPGVKKEDITLLLQEGRLTISVSHSEEKSEKSDGKKQYVRQERRYSSMSRTLYLPEAARDGVKATLQEGVLKITVPKDQQMAKNQKIEIE